MLLTLAFTTQSIIVLNGRLGTVFTTTVEKNANEGRIFDKEDGLQFAIAVIDFNGENFDDVEGREFNEYLNLGVY